jgi:hypothetical protein
LRLGDYLCPRGGWSVPKHAWDISIEVGQILVLFEKRAFLRSNRAPKADTARGTAA